METKSIIAPKDATGILERWMKSSSQYVNLPAYIQQAIEICVNETSHHNNLEVTNLSVVFFFQLKTRTISTITKLSQIIKEFDTNLIRVLKTIENRNIGVSNVVISDSEANSPSVSPFWYSRGFQYTNTILGKQIHCDIISKDVTTVHTDTNAYRIEVHNRTNNILSSFTELNESIEYIQDILSTELYLD